MSQGGLHGRDYDRLREQARRKLPRFLFDYVDGGSFGEQCLRRNRLDLDAIGLIARPLASATTPDCDVVVGGQAIALPLAIAPTGLNDLLRPGGDTELARAAARAGVPFIQSGASFTAYPDVCAIGGPQPWYQIYVHDVSVALARLAELRVAGCEDLVVTIDMPVGGVRYRDLVNRFGPRLSVPMMRQMMMRPGWLLRAARAWIAPPVMQHPLPAAIAHRRFDISFGWSELRRLREAWPGRLWLKGVLHPDDARLAHVMGADGIIVSNHGGRQLDLSPSSWQAFPAIRAQVPKDFPLLIDGGVRSGEDIARAVALGASAVLIGRAALWSLADRGEAGVSTLLERLRHELVVTMRLLGCGTVAELASLEPIEVRRSDR